MGRRHGARAILGGNHFTTTIHTYQYLLSNRRRGGVIENGSGGGVGTCVRKIILEARGAGLPRPSHSGRKNIYAFVRPKEEFKRI